MSDIITARHPAPVAPALPVAALLSAHQMAALAQQLRADLARDTALARRLRQSGADTTHVARRIAATRDSLLDLGDA